MSFFARTKVIFDDLLSQPRHLLALRLTLMLLLLHGATSWKLDVPLRILCGITIICIPMTVSSVVWLLVTAATVWVNAMSWYSIDNHKYLITYWCLACALAVAAKDPDRVLSWNGRMLIGFCFLFATLWKFLSGEFVDGSFLHHTFLTDQRVEATASFLGGFSPAVLAQDRAFNQTILALPGAGIGATMMTSDGLRLATILMSYWTLLIEGGVAIAFLSSRPRWLHEKRDFLLMAFIGTTYFLLPVIGFAFTLALLGFAQCPVEKKKTRIAYLVLFVMIQLTRIPWDDFFSDYLLDVGTVAPG